MTLIITTTGYTAVTGTTMTGIDIEIMAETIETERNPVDVTGTTGLKGMRKRS